MDRSSLEKVLSSYQHLGNQAWSSAYAAFLNEDTHEYLRWFLLDMPVVPFLLAFHSLYAAIKVYGITPPRTHWLKVRSKVPRVPSLQAHFTRGEMYGAGF